MTEEEAKELAKHLFDNLTDSAKIEIVKILRESLPVFNEKENNND